MQKVAQDISPEDLREAIRKNPAVILDDPETLRCLLDNNKPIGNIVSFQGFVVERLREKLSLAEEDHRALLEIAIANMHALDQIHEACVLMLEADSAAELVNVIQEQLPSVLGTDYVNLAMERQISVANPFLEATIVEPGALGFYFQLGGSVPVAGSQGKIVLRHCYPEADILYAGCKATYKSEALVMLNLGPHKRPAMMLFADTDPERFGYTQSAELLSFMGRVVELIIQKWQTI